MALTMKMLNKFCKQMEDCNSKDHVELMQSVNKTAAKLFKWDLESRWPKLRKVKSK